MEGSRQVCVRQAPLLPNCMGNHHWFSIQGRHQDATHAAGMVQASSGEPRSCAPLHALRLQCCWQSPCQRGRHEVARSLRRPRRREVDQRTSHSPPRVQVYYGVGSVPKRHGESRRQRYDAVRKLPQVMAPRRSWHCPPHTCQVDFRRVCNLLCLPRENAQESQSGRSQRASPRTTAPPRRPEGRTLVLQRST